MEELGRGAVVEEARQRIVESGQVSGEHQDAGWCVGAAPFGESVEAAAQDAEVVHEAVLGQWLAGVGGPLVEVEFVALDVRATEIGDPCDGRVGGGDEPGEFAQDRLGPSDGGGPQRHGDLVEIADQCRRQVGGDVRPSLRRCRQRAQTTPARRQVELAGVEQGCLGPEQSGGDPHVPAADRAVLLDRGDELVPSAVQERAIELIWRDLLECGDFHQRGPLQLGRTFVEPELRRHRRELGEELAVDVTADRPHPRARDRHIRSARFHALRGEQPAHHPPILPRHFQLLLQGHLLPGRNADVDEERAGHRIVGEASRPAGGCQ